jgi:hypothetical protein
MVAMAHRQCIVEALVEHTVQQAHRTSRVQTGPHRQADLEAEEVVLVELGLSLPRKTAVRAATARRGTQKFVSLVANLTVHQHHII